MRHSILPSLFCPMASVQLFYIGAGNPIIKGSRSHMFYDVPGQCCHMPTSRTHVLGLAWLTLLPDPIFPDRCFSQLPHIPAGDRMLFKDNRRYYNVLKGGMDVALSFPKACDVLLGTPGVLLDLLSPNKRTESSNSLISKLLDANNILCLQEVHGKDDYLQAIQVLAPRFRFFGTFIPDNENAGGSAICIHRDLLPEEAIVTHSFL